MQSVKFKKPPLKEVVFGVNIEISELSLVHFGLYWETIKEKFPTTIENFGGLTLTGDENYTPSFPAVWYLSSEENRLIRLTKDYFSYHCRCIKEDYQHFENLFEEFLNEWNRLESWWLYFSQQQIKVKQYSLRYINIIDENSNWRDLEDNSKVFSLFKQEIKTSLGLPETYLSEFRFELPDNFGELEISLETSQQEVSGLKKNFMIFYLSTFSKIMNGKFQKYWFDSAHDFIIQSFLDLTTEEAQNLWERVYE